MYSIFFQTQRPQSSYFWNGLSVLINFIVAKEQEMLKTKCEWNQNKFSDMYV